MAHPSCLTKIKKEPQPGIGNMSENKTDTAITALFDYLRNVIYEPKNASLTVEELPEEFQQFGTGLKFFSECVMETTALALALSRGSLDEGLPSRANEIAAPLKSLHASLRHLTWQAQRIAEGDYKQRVSFMGEFSGAFNTMVEQLAEREQKLEEKIRQIEEKTSALEQGNLLLTTLVHYVPQQIFVIHEHNNEIVLTNDIASNELKQNAGYLEDIMRLIAEQEEPDSGGDFDITYEYDGVTRYFVISRFSLEWHGSDAEVYAISDVSETRKELADLETHAYRDSLTNLYNRAFGMMTLDLWLREKRRFALTFVDLDSLKYVNDVFGHAEGDIYIMRAGEHLKAFSPDAVVCRIGGDEFMLLATGFGFDDAYVKMNELAKNLRNDEYQKDKDYTYNMSFGIAAVDANNRMPAGDILGAADLRMYENKQRNKQKKKQASTK